MTRPAYIILAAVLSLPASAAAQDRTAELDARHAQCLERIAEDQQLALEEAMIWRDQGGGRRARHCEAMALFALGYEGEAATRLDALADGGDGGSEAHRINFRREAADLWIAAGDASRAHASASAGLELDARDAGLRIARARAYALAKRFDYAETDLSTVLAFHPRHAEALRYRADARFRQDRLDAALDDIERSLQIDLTSVDSALLRGRIREAIRLADIEPSDENGTPSGANAPN